MLSWSACIAPSHAGSHQLFFINSWRTPWWFSPAKALPSEHPVTMSKGIPEPKQRCISPKSATKWNKSLTFLDHDENKWPGNIIWNIFWTYREFTRPWLPKHVIQAPMLSWSKPENGAAMENNEKTTGSTSFHWGSMANSWIVCKLLDFWSCFGSWRLLRQHKGVR